MNETMMAIRKHLVDENVWMGYERIADELGFTQTLVEEACQELASQEAIWGENVEGVLLFTANPRWQPPEDDDV